MNWGPARGRRRRFSGGPEYEAVIFDMDGLLLDTEIADRRSWQRAASDYGCSVSDTDFESVLGRTPVDTGNLLSEIWVTRHEPAEHRRKIEVRKQEYFRSETIALKPGADLILDWLASQRIPCAIASSSSRRTIEDHVAATGLGRTGIAVLVGGDEVDHGKPAPDIFITAADRLDTQPELCVVLEDSEAGVAAAAAANMIPVMVPDRSVRTTPISAPALDLAYRWYDSLVDVLGQLADG